MEFALNERVLTASQTRGCIGSYPWFYDSEEGDEEVLSGEPKKGMDVVSETEDTRDKGYCFALFKIVWCFGKAGGAQNSVYQNLEFLWKRNE
ncbi:hypothetical protein HZH68_016169 [Vespula germanica]|uniref:Uncharacterized protein n=1 Tax=Vespula germanica TaxID=30212 RepID=A0A834J3Z9_VESGE|nr:hypothetical protein HZH68_016169 [Vespula germanica]